MVAVATPQRRYLVRLGIAMSLYLVTLFAATYLVERGLIDGAALWLAAALPGVAMVGAFYAIGMLIVELKDEFVRMLLVRQVLYASGLTMAAASVWGFLENFGLVAHLPAFYWAIVWFAGFGLGAAINRLTLGASGACP